MEAVANRKPILADSEKNARSFGAGMGAFPAWRDGLCRRYTFIAVPKKSTEYRVMVVSPLGSFFKIKSYGPVGDFIPSSDPYYAEIRSGFNKGAGPYFRRSFDEGGFKRLLEALARNPELEVVQGEFNSIVNAIRNRVNDKGWEDTTWHPQGNGIATVDQLYEIAESRRVSTN